jgi:UDP-3-O-[3-hydroxymyristoyl] N-acetylglucosamine deacetylase
MLARALLEEKESWELVTFEQAERAPVGVIRWLNQPA